ncbi:MAG: hypothetical protein AB7G13_22410 [Lautropia sp.]
MNAADADARIKAIMTREMSAVQRLAEMVTREITDSEREGLYKLMPDIDFDPMRIETEGEFFAAVEAAIHASLGPLRSRLATLAAESVVDRASQHR